MFLSLMATDTCDLYSVICWIQTHKSVWCVNLWSVHLTSLSCQKGWVVSNNLDWVFCDLPCSKEFLMELWWRWKPFLTIKVQAACSIIVSFKKWSSSRSNFVKNLRWDIEQIGRAHVWTPVTRSSRMPSSAWKKKNNKKKKKKNNILL